jgi:hypothetical protein
MDTENICLRAVLDIPASSLKDKDLEDFKHSLEEGDFNNARIILIESVSEDAIINAFCDSATFEMLYKGVPITDQVSDLGVKSYTY